MKKVKPLSVYEITKDTMAIIPYYNEFGHLFSEIREFEHQTKHVALPPLQVIKKGCLHYGSSYQGRKEAIRQMMGNMAIAPILISSRLGIYFFPLESPSNESCIWLSQPHIRRLERVDSEQSKIIFSNGTSLIVNQPRGSLQSKLYRTAQFRCLLNERTSQGKEDSMF